MILALDTSTHTMTVALVDLEEEESGFSKVIAQREKQANRNHSILLVTEIRAMLEEAGKSMDDVKAIAVGQGPGSYTGVRVGVTVAKTLAWSLNIPLVGVSSLAALAFGVYRKQRAENRVGNGTSWIIPCIDARRGNAYSALFAMSAEGFDRVEEDQKRLMADWLPELEQKAGQVEQIWFAGETDKLDPNIFAEKKEDHPEPTTIEARDVGHLGALRLRLGEHEHVHTFTPNYTQKADVEVKFSTLKKHKGLL